MPLFDTHVVVDWSAQSRPTSLEPSKNAIWWVAVRDGSVGQPEYVRTRHAAVQRLVEFISSEVSAGHRVLVGFDLPFGYPAGVAAHLTGRACALRLWEWLAARIADAENNANNRYAVARDINREYPGVGPFWGRPKVWTCPDVPVRAKERTDCSSHPPEMRIADSRARGAKSVWQLFGNGSVGSQVLLGQPAINSLRKAPSLSCHTAIWPFESGLRVPDRRIVIAEVYPSLLRKAVAERRREGEILDRAQVRVNAEAFASLDARGGLAALFEGTAGLTPQQRRVAAAEEGWILGLGHEMDLRSTFGWR